MLKAWAKVFYDTKIRNDSTADMTDGDLTGLTAVIDTLCYALNLSRPIILPKHIKELDTYNRTKFMPEHFMESVDFDYLELELYESKKK